MIADLFKSTGRNPLDILKWKEVYLGLEEACDSCRDYSQHHRQRRRQERLTGR